MVMRKELTGRDVPLGLSHPGCEREAGPGRGTAPGRSARGSMSVFAVIAIVGRERVDWMAAPRTRGGRWRLFAWRESFWIMWEG